MAIYKNANLDISVSAEQNPSYNAKPSVQFSTQDKNTAKYTFTVKQNNKPVDLTGVTASVTLYSEDKSVFQSDATITSATEGKIEYVIPSEAIRHHGKTRGDLRLTYPNGDVLGGLRFSFNIEQALIDRAAGVVGGVYIRDFEQLKAEIEATAESIKDFDVARVDMELKEKATKQEVQQVTAQLADTVKEVNGVKPTNGKVVIPVPEVDTSNLATKTDVQQLSLTFKESYPTLTDLQTAYPNGSNTNHVVLADNMIYTYKNGWISTGIQGVGTGIANGAVTPSKTTFINQNANQFNKDDSTIVRGKYANSQNDVDVTDAFITHLIPVKGGDVIRWNKYPLYKSGTNIFGGRVMKEDKSYQYNLGASNVTDKDTYFETTITGSTNKFVQLNGTISDIQNFRVVVNQEFPSSSVPFGYELKKEINLPKESVGESTLKKNSVNGEIIQKGVIDIDHTKFIKKSANEFNSKDERIVKGKFANAQNDVVNEKAFYTYPIQVNGGDTVRWKRHSLFVNGSTIYGGRAFNSSGNYSYNVSASNVTLYDNYFEHTVSGTTPKTLYLNGHLDDLNSFIVTINQPYPTSFSKPGYQLDERVQVAGASQEPVKTENVEFLKHLFLKTLCIGDSLTQGAYYSPELNGQEIKENYPYYLGKLTGWEVTNGGKSGFTTLQWWDLRAKANTYDFSTFDTFIICLGTNGGLTDTLETDATGNDYNQYADTNTGAYCKIIEKIKQSRPDARIFVTNVFGSSGDLAVTNRVIGKIATRYNLPTPININDGVINRGDIFHPFGNTLHFGKVGNLHFAKTILDQLLSLVNKNLAHYERILIP